MQQGRGHRPKVGRGSPIRRGKVRRSLHYFAEYQQIQTFPATMIALNIAPQFKTRIPGLTVGFLTASVTVTQHNEGLWREIDAAAAGFRGMTMEQARRYPAIKALRESYRGLGLDPTRYRGSSEALVRRITQGKELYRVNTVVDINNLISLETLNSVGTYDLESLQPPIVFREGEVGETYCGIGRGEIRLECLPVFADQLGPFGSTTSDSERSMVRLDTKKILLVNISFLGSDDMMRIMERAVELLTRYADARASEIGLAT